MEGQVLARNLSLAKQAEIRAEKQRVSLGLVPEVRISVINRAFVKGSWLTFTPEARKRKSERLSRDLR